MNRNIDTSLSRRSTRMKHVIGSTAAAAFALVSTIAVSSAAQADRGRYLDKYPDAASLHFTLPPTPVGPKQGDAGMVDLDQVKAAQLNADEATKAEAFADAEAFSFDALMPRFSVAAGRTLAPARTPILAHMLKWALADTNAYGSMKNGPQRQRPFTEDPSILPCDQYYLSLTTTPKETFTYSYPSGHATNGYLAGLVIALVIPDHKERIMARGVRYGTNRIVCGVHYPSDVAVGQLFARALFAVMSDDPQFKADMICAREEDALDRTGAIPNFPAQTDEPGRQAAAAKVYSATCAPVAVAAYDDVMKIKP